MALNPKPERRKWKRGYIRERAIHEKKVKQLRVGATYIACSPGGDRGVVLEFDGPYQAPYMTYGRYFQEYDLLMGFEDGTISMHGLHDCCDLDLSTDPGDFSRVQRIHELMQSGMDYWQASGSMEAERGLIND